MDIRAIGQAMNCLTVAAAGTITDYCDVLARGYLKQDPALVVHRLDLLCQAIATVRVAADREAASGEWGPPGAQLGSPGDAHQQDVAAYAAHTCNCEWCLHGEAEWGVSHG